MAEDTRKILIDVEVKSNIEEISRMTLQVKKLRDENKELSKNYAVNSESIEVNRATISNLTQAIRQKQTVLKAEIKDMDEASGAYARLNLQSQLASQRAKDLAVAYGIESKEAKEAVLNAKNLSDKLISVDASMNQNGRNVGNYKSGFNGLSNSINQITREAPAFANSINTGFMAISNNIPIFVDQIKALRDQNRLLKEEGQQQVPVWKQLMSGIFSWQTALSLGVTALTFFGGSIIKYFSGEDSETKKATKNIKEQAEAVDTLTESIIKQNVVQTNNKIDIEDSVQTEIELIKAKEAVYDIGKKVQAGSDEYNRSLDEGQQKDNIVMDLKKKSISQLLAYYKEFKLYNDESKNIYGAMGDDLDAYILALIKQRQIEQQIKDASIKTSKEKHNQEKQIKKEALELEKNIRASLSLLDDDYQLRQDEAYKAHKEAIIALKNDEVFTAEEKAYYTIQLEKHLQKQLLEIKKQHLNYASKLEYTTIEDNHALALAKSENNRRELLNLQLEVAQEYLETLRQMETDGSEAQAKQKLLLIQNQENKVDKTKVDIQNLNLQTELNNARSNDQLIYETKLKYLQKELSDKKGNADEVAKINKEIADLEIAEQMRVIAKRKEIANEIIGIANNIATVYKNREDAQVKATDDANNAKKESLKAKLDAGIISQKKYDNEVKKLDAEADKQKAIIARKQAIRSRNLSLAQVIINTIESESKTFATLGYPAGVPAAIIAGVVGAAETAAIMSTEIPKASKGMLINGKSHSQGGQLVEAEGGEVIINKRSSQAFMGQLSAINEWGGGVKFANGGVFNDGGYSVRNSIQSSQGITKSEMIDIISSQRIYVSVEDIRKGDKKYSDIESGGKY